VPPGGTDMAQDEHYLKTELYELVRRDPAIFEFLQAGRLGADIPQIVAYLRDQFRLALVQFSADHVRYSTRVQ